LKNYPNGSELDRWLYKGYQPFRTRLPQATVWTSFV